MKSKVLTVAYRLLIRSVNDLSALTHAVPIIAYIPFGLVVLAAFVLPRILTFPHKLTSHKYSNSQRKRKRKPQVNAVTACTMLDRNFRWVNK